MKPGDLVKLRVTEDTYFDWKDSSTRSAGYWLRETKTLNLGSFIFSKKEVCLVIDIVRNSFALVLTPRQQIGCIHMDMIEVASEEG